MYPRLQTVLLGLLLTGISVGAGIHDIAHLHSVHDPVQTVSIAVPQAHLLDCAPWHRGGMEFGADVTRSSSPVISDSPRFSAAVREKAFQKLFVRGPARAPPFIS